MGGALIPWLVGLTSARFGDLRIGLLIPLFCVVDDCLADCYYPGAGSGAFAKSPISIVFVNRPPRFANPLTEPSEPAFRKSCLAGKEALSSSAFERQRPNAK
jgi:hypothetical protein